MLVDSHAHLDDGRFAADLPLVLERAKEAGVAWVVTVGIDLASSKAAVSLAHRFPMVVAAVGIHPHEAKTADARTLQELARLARDPRVVAIGEIGLDYHYNHSSPAIQREVFAAQLRLAGELDLPVVVHDREAHEDVEAILSETAPPRAGVLHCFSGDAAMAARLVERGFYLSFAGPVTFNRSKDHFCRVLAAVPLGRILVETDCPYLSPAPFRGQRNEPARVRLVAERVAELLGLGVDEVIRATGEASANFFGLPAVGSGRKIPVDGESLS